jgi:type VI protein secretion system component VasK
MSIENRQQLQNTRAKLEQLERLYSTTRDRPASSEHVRELTLGSLKKRINQFKEEIARFEAGVGHVARTRVIGPGPEEAG